MSSIPLSDKPYPSLLSSLWFSFDKADEDKELWLLEQEVAAELERVESRYCENVPLGKTGNESAVDEEDDDDEEEDDNDDEESESNDDDDDQEADMEVGDPQSPTLF